MEKTNKMDEKRLSAGEISDVARVVIAYSLLADDKKNSKENLFIDKETTDKVDAMIEKLKALIHDYLSNKETAKRVIRKVEQFELISTFQSRDIVTTVTLVALNLLYLSLAPNSRIFQYLAPRLKAFWDENSKDIMDVLYKASDLNETYKDYQVNGEDFSYFILDRV